MYSILDCNILRYDVVWVSMFIDSYKLVYCHTFVYSLYRNEWQEQSVLMEQYLKTLNIMNRELSRLPRVSDYAEEALLAANSALGESEIVAHKVLELSLRIKNELRVKVIELQSFSPEEMAHIPRKCEYYVNISG